ncbi:efflux RND transporter periplasmic adaptor subunit [Aquicoccus porphyridii]|uniref:Efflux RND transporter periplasmic adaptor subunit n=1 Tax=Aquicoccus porphyridii TaxID=1852029 RepID=A0A5A9ZKR6_9RHOB|nr:efflux RND transporter periplasmic adaptor subunit [Aquicoccus porphyridii]KAA0917770.1 efflux RND transporter periplasmic adaptor subunit [Aquicoccus porphyridii]RAI55840.1 efflux transporter periplasmic adaptor subunit [Rhodobacteraceae bacterium AsT-22]
MVKRLVIAVILLALVGGGLVGFNVFRDRMIEQVFANMPVQPLTVETVVAQPVTWQPVLNAIGTANANQGVELTVESAGILREILFEPNTQVEEGQLLIRLDNVVQRADLEAARTQLELERANLARQQELQSRGIATSAILEATQAAFRAAEAQVARAEAVVEQREVRAPFEGTIGLLRVDLGQYVQPGTIIATLQDLGTMRVDFSLAEQSLPDLFIGQTLHLSSDDARQTFEGQISGIDPRVDPSSRLVAVRGTVEQSDDSLTPGQFVRLRLDLPEEEDVIALNQTAVVSSLYGDFVYVVRPREDDPDALAVQQVFVKPGRRSNGMIEIREGISAGDRVVTSGQNRLSNNAPVILADAQADDEAEE